jgi:Mn-dependent DtxR family transcriptional regulator
MLNLKNEKIQKIHHKSKLSILSIANILDQPKESVRRRVNKLIKLNLIIKDKKTNGIMLTEKYREIIKKFGVVTTNKFILLIQNMDKNNFLSEILNDNKKNIKIVEALDNKN